MQPSPIALGLILKVASKSRETPTNLEKWFDASKKTKDFEEYLPLAADGVTVLTVEAATVPPLPTQGQESTSRAPGRTFVPPMLWKIPCQKGDFGTNTGRTARIRTVGCVCVRGAICIALPTTPATIAPIAHMRSIRTMSRLPNTFTKFGQAERTLFALPRPSRRPIVRLLGTLFRPVSPYLRPRHPVSRPPD